MVDVIERLGGIKNQFLIMVAGVSEQRHRWDGQATGDSNGFARRMHVASASKGTGSGKGIVRVTPYRSAACSRNGFGYHGKGSGTALRGIYGQNASYAYALLVLPPYENGSAVGLSR